MIRASQDRYRSHRWPEPDDLRVLNDSVLCTIVPSRRHGPAGMGPEGQRQQPPEISVFNLWKSVA